MRKYLANLWAFDLDGTLHTNVLPIKEAVTHLMIEQIARLRNVSLPNAVALRKIWLDKHQTSSTLVAIKKEGYDVKEFIEKTYLSVDLKFMLQPNAALIVGLQLLQGRKVILTNNPKQYAEAVLFALGLGNSFDAIYGIEETDFYLKPDVRAYIPLMGSLGMQGRVMFDNVPENLVAASRLGFHTVLVGDAKVPPLGVHVHVLRLEDYFYH